LKKNLSEKVSGTKMSWKEKGMIAGVVAGAGLAGFFLFKFLPLYLWYRLILKPEYQKAVGSDKKK
jgi:galactokinase/mevalonate kinase-like predicted kinase